MYQKTAKLRRIIEKRIGWSNDSVRRRFYFWKLMVKQKAEFELGNKVHGFGRKVIQRVQRKLEESGRAGEISGKLKQPIMAHKSLFPVCVAMDRYFKDVIEQIFIRNKNWAIRKLKLLFLFEQLVLASGQPLLIRTIRLREDRLIAHYHRPIKAAFSPADIIRFFNEKAAHFENTYNMAEISAFGNKTYFTTLMSRKKLMDPRLNTAGLLITGSWSKAEPYLRFRETFLMNVVRNSYITNLMSGYQVLLGFKNRANVKESTKAYFMKKSAKFKRIWGKLFVKSLINMKLRKTHLYILTNLRINAEISNLMEDLNKSKLEDKKILPVKKLNKRDMTSAHKLISQSYIQIKKTFANGFLNILLDTSHSKQELKSQLKYYIFSKLFELCSPLVAGNYGTDDDDSENN